MTQGFLQKYGPFGDSTPIKIRTNAPSDLRLRVPALATTYGADMNSLATLLGIRLEVNPRDLVGLKARDSQSSLKNIMDAYMSSEWFYLYAFIEDAYEELLDTKPRSTQHRRAGKFELAINEYFNRHGIGWSLVHGKIAYRGDGNFEAAKTSALESLEDAGLQVALDELSKSVKALSERPIADLTGAMTHARASVESVLREVTGKNAKSFSKHVKDNPGLFPPTLGDAMAKIFAYVGDSGAHPKEGQAITTDEAELVVHVSAAAATYLIRKSGLIDGDSP